MRMKDMSGDDIERCWFCKEPLEEAWNYCPDCGVKIDATRLPTGL